MSECKLGPCGLHCNCFNDIDWDFPGCQWCQLLERERKRDEQIAAMNLQIEAMRYVVEAAQTVISKNVSRPEVYLDGGDNGKYKLALALQALTEKRKGASENS